MSFISQSSATVKASMKKALERYVAKGNQTVITDIYLQPKLDTAELVVLNDDDEVLAQVSIKEWEREADENFYELAEQAFRTLLLEMQQASCFDNLCLLKPYSFVLVDDDKETVAELLLIDDGDTLVLSDELLKGLDEELNAFLKDLLEK